MAIVWVWVRLFLQKDGETVGNPIEEGDSNGGRGSDQWVLEGKTTDSPLKS